MYGKQSLPVDKRQSKLKNSLKHLSMNWGRLSKTSMRSTMFKQGTFTKWQTVSLLYLQSDAFNCLAWFSLDLELILFDYLKYFGTELKNVQCQLVFVWGGAEAQSGDGGGGREIYEKSLHHSDSNADYRDQYCTNMLFAQANIFAVPRSHFSIIDSS